jgi:hypothetical protein
VVLETFCCTEKRQHFLNTNLFRDFVGVICSKTKWIQLNSLVQDILYPSYNMFNRKDRVISGKAGKAAALPKCSGTLSLYPNQSGQIIANHWL